MDWKRRRECCGSNIIESRKRYKIDLWLGLVTLVEIRYRHTVRHVHDMLSKLHLMWARALLALCSGPRYLVYVHCHESRSDRVNWT